MGTLLRNELNWKETFDRIFVGDTETATGGVL